MEPFRWRFYRARSAARPRGHRAAVRRRDPIRANQVRRVAGLCGRRHGLVRRLAGVARRVRASIVILFAGAAKTRGPFHLTMNTNEPGVRRTIRSS